MTLQTPTVDQYRLTVDADDVIRETLTYLGDTERGQALTEVLSAVDCSDRNTTHYTLPAGVNLGHDSFSPENDLPEIDRWPSALQGLTETGFATESRILTEHSSAAYLSDDIQVTAVQVPEAFTVVPVRYLYAETYGVGRIPVRGWTVGEALEVPAGVYLIGSTGDFTSRDVVTVYLDETGDDIDTLFYTVAESEEYGVTHASAGCDADESHRWEAESGSWHFTGEYSGATTGENYTAPDYDYDDTEDHDGDTHACPVEGCGGRVGYSVY